MVFAFDVERGGICAQTEPSPSGVRNAPALLVKNSPIQLPQDWPPVAPCLPSHLITPFTQPPFCVSARMTEKDGSKKMQLASEDRYLKKARGAHHLNCGDNNCALFTMQHVSKPDVNG